MLTIGQQDIRGGGGIVIIVNQAQLDSMCHTQLVHSGEIVSDGTQPTEEIVPGGIAAPAVFHPVAAVPLLDKDFAVMMAGIIQAVIPAVGKQDITLGIQQDIRHPDMIIFGRGAVGILCV
ncbi:MAG: hypothetical protein BWY71_01844 [Planctomycetes bacterium ADurb.Bin412]|nr:MAG: hypothetical protein BWY71_01844 [Planctomycetes bacterium ADurb.Bin412]